MKISVQPRNLLDSKFKMRNQGLIPGIIYSKTKNNPIVISLKTLMAIKKSHEPIIQTEQGEMLVLKELQTDPISQKPIHVSFQEINHQQKFTISIPLSFNTKDVIFSNQGMILKHFKEKISVKTTAQSMLDHIEVDVSGLAVHDILRIKDLKLPEGIECLEDDNLQVIMLDYINRVDEPELETVTSIVPPNEVPLVKETLPKE